MKKYKTQQLNFNSFEFICKFRSENRALLGNTKGSEHFSVVDETDMCCPTNQIIDIPK
jgi:hypothetical protein